MQKHSFENLKQSLPISKSTQLVKMTENKNMNVNDMPIGRVIATEKNPSTTGNVRFWLESDAQLKPFDIVRLKPSNEEDGEFYAIIKEINQVSDETSPLSGFMSADFGQSSIEPRVSRIVTTYADATVLYNTKKNEMPVPHGAKVHWPNPEDVRRALGIEDFSRKTPAGFITMSGPNKQRLSIPVDMDADYLIGPEGGHINISGISGLATKTSYGMFLLTAIQQKQDTDWQKGNKASFLILNVKGNDLLRLHEEAKDLDDATKKEWEQCNLTPQPFQNVTYFYPYSKQAEQLNVQTKLDKESLKEQFEAKQAFRFYYDIKAVIKRLPLLVEDIEDPSQTMVSCAEHSREKQGDFGSWEAYISQLNEWTQKGQQETKTISVMSWRKFRRLISQRSKNEVFTERAVNADKKRMVLLKEFLHYLKNGSTVVIDIAQLPDYLQSFIVGDIITLIRNAKSGNIEFEDDTDEFPELETVLLFADELNKFAPKQHSQRTITKHLREISERGRSEGIILCGAEQFRTGVDTQVTGNSSTQVFGRTTAVEANRDTEIKELPNNQRQRVPFLQKGELLIQHPRFSAGTLKIRFPKNAYKTG